MPPLAEVTLVMRYGVAAQGQRATPYLITKVTSANGGIDYTVKKKRLTVFDKEVTGGTYPVRIWTAFMKGALKGEKVIDFPPRVGVGDTLLPPPPPPPTTTAPTTAPTTTATTGPTTSGPTTPGPTRPHPTKPGPTLP